MSTPELPDDVSRWPGDPYQLLGVWAGVAQRELRQAYTALIRIYKPEQFPEQFRRIRAAYEAVLRDVEIRRPTEDFEAEFDAGDAPSAVYSNGASFRYFRGGSAGPDWEEALETAWNQACEGQETEAYGVLQRLQESRPGASDIYLRLYWLLTLAPEVDAARQPRDWLMAGIHATGLGGPLAELLRREISETPSFALDDACTQLVRDTPRVDALLNFLDWRWRAASQRSRWSVVRDDVQMVHERFLAENEQAWARLLILAIGYLTWAAKAGGGEAAAAQSQAWLHDLEQATHLHKAVGTELDHLDFLQALAKTWHDIAALPHHPDTFCVLIHDSWLRSPAELRGSTETVLSAVAREPHSFLSYFQSLHNTRTGAALTQYGKILIDYASTFGRRLPPETCPDAAITAVLQQVTPMRDYDRAHLLNVCMNEAVSPKAIANLVAGLPFDRGPNHSHLSRLLQDDWPLRYVFLSWWLFWQ